MYEIAVDRPDDRTAVRCYRRDRDEPHPNQAVAERCCFETTLRGHDAEQVTAGSGGAVIEQPLELLELRRRFVHRNPIVADVALRWCGSGERSGDGAAVRPGAEWVSQPSRID
jgi:hypothetical protein